MTQKPEIDVKQKLAEQLKFAMNLISEKKVADRNIGTIQIQQEYKELSKENAGRLFDQASKELLRQKYQRHADQFVRQLISAGQHPDAKVLVSKYPQVFNGPTAERDAVAFRDAIIMSLSPKPTATPTAPVMQPTQAPPPKQPEAKKVELTETVKTSEVKPTESVQAVAPVKPTEAVKLKEPKDLISPAQVRAPIWRAFKKYSDDPLAEDVKLNQLVTGIFSPRSAVPDDKYIEQLAENLKTHGQEYAIIIMPRTEGKYAVVAGECRVLALRKLNAQTVKAVVVKLTDEQAFALALASNLEHEYPFLRMKEVEEARALKRLIDEFKWTQEKASEIFGRSQRWVSYRLDLLKVPDKVADQIDQRVLTPTHVREISKAPEPLKQVVADKVVSEKLSTKQTEQIVKDIVKTPETASQTLAKTGDELKATIGVKPPKPPSVSVDVMILKPFEVGWTCDCGREYKVHVEPDKRRVDFKQQAKDKKKASS